MRKSTIWFIALAMAFSFLSLLYIQTRYFQETIHLRKEQFDENVKRGLWMVAHRLEIDEAKGLLQNSMSEKDKEEFLANDSIGIWPKNLTSLPGNASQQLALQSSGKKESYLQKRQSEFLAKYLQHKNLLEEVIYSSLYIDDDEPLSERTKQLDSYLKAELKHCGIDIEHLQYHYVVLDNEGDTVSICPDYNDKGLQYSYPQTLFANSTPEQVGTLIVHFPSLHSYLLSNIRFLIPAILFTLFLLIVFSYTIYIIFRQKKLSEMKTDFVNIMTHEFKTPISTISLAAQMLGDSSITKSETMFKHISHTITEETRRLRFQVEKVLQMSMFEENRGTFRMEEVDMHAIINNGVDSFRLKVSSIGGDITVNLNAEESVVYGDEVHLTNLIFNLLENAVKYRDNERQLQLNITTANQGKHINIAISDNGIGIKSDDVKRVFEKFYRSHTGNRHDVKGFGLGLAYVKKVVLNHNGHIHVESEVGKGSRFVISLPLISQ